MRRHLLLCVLLFTGVCLSAQTRNIESRIIGSWRIIPVFSVDINASSLHASTYDFDRGENGSLTFHPNGTGAASVGEEVINFNWKLDEEGNLSISYQDYSSVSALREIDPDTIMMFENQGTRGYVVVLKRAS